ncbi:MAG TPA: tetratricopeptide repeat protein [Phycisphaerae bacterium]|nr:tetratricopeptide repeat protein [Phycisphaerae bacterium]
MTVAETPSPSKASQRPLARAHPNPWRRLWQIPLLLAGITAFGFGLRAFMHTIKPVPFERQAAGIQSLIEAGKDDAGNYTKAVEEINRIGPYYTRPEQQALLQVFAGDAIYLAQRQQPAIVPENYKRVEEHYEKAVAWGVVPSALMNERWGDAALALGEAKTAVQKLEAALEQSHEDPNMVQRHAQELVAAYLEEKDPGRARGMVDMMLEALRQSPPDEEMEMQEKQVWCLSKRIEIALAAGDTKGLKSAIAGAREGIAEFKERDPKGRVLIWIGRGRLELGEPKGAEEDLTEARKDFAVHHLDDGRAAIMLARLAVLHGKMEEAEKLFEEVCVGHAGSPVWAAARLGRADVNSRIGAFGKPEVLEDYQFALETLKDRAAAPIGKKPEFLNDDDVRASLIDSYERAREAKKYEEALRFLALEQKTEVSVTAENALRRAQTRELRAREILESNVQAARAMMVAAAQDYLLHASLTTLQDEVSGKSLWKGAELLDQAGDTAKAIEVYDRLTIQRPRDGRVAEGLLILGGLYESAGQVDKALATYERNRRENPTASAAYLSQINEARCYVTLAKGVADVTEREEKLANAEKLLLGLVQDNNNLLPTAREFHDGLLALSALYYDTRDILSAQALGPIAAASTAPNGASAPGSSGSAAASTAPNAGSAVGSGAVAAASGPSNGALTAGSGAKATASAPAPGGITAGSGPIRGRWSDAILRLDEFLERYPNDAQTARVTFMLAESYRKSALEIAEAQKDPAMATREELERARGERLAVAADYFTRVIGLLDAELAVTPEAARPLTQVERMYLRTAYMDRGACLYARGDYEQAIRRYTEAAARFSEEVLAVDAYVQIVNAYLAMKQPAQAAAAADRGLWILKRVPEDAFKRVPAGGAGRGEYERLLTLK